MVPGSRSTALWLLAAALACSVVVPAAHQDPTPLCGATNRSPKQLVEELEPLGEPARVALLALAQSADLTEALCGIAGLSALDDARVIPPLAAALARPAWRDSAYQLARWAAMVAGGRDPERGAAMRPVIDALDDRAVWRAAGADAVWLLGEIDQARARDRLLAELEQPQDDATLDAVIHALARQGDARARTRVAALGDEAARAKSGNATPEQARRLGEVAFYQMALAPASVDEGLATLGTIALRDQREAAAWAVHTLCARESRRPAEAAAIEAHRRTLVDALDARGIDWHAVKGPIGCGVP